MPTKTRSATDDALAIRDVTMKTMYDISMLGVAIALGMAGFGCAEIGNHIDPNDGYQVIGSNYDGADCVEGDICENGFKPGRDIYKAPFKGNRMSDSAFPNGYFGYIDANCHSIRSQKGRADVDIVGFDVEPGTPMRVMVLNATRKSPLSPVIYLLSSTGADLIFSAASSANSTGLEFLAPTSRFYISVESSDNDDANGSASCEPGITHHGGDSYGYAVTVETIAEKELVDSFGEISNPKEYHIKMNSSSGHAHYYKAKVAEGKDLSVEIKTPASMVTPTIAPIDRRSGYDWTLTGDALKNTFDVATNTARAKVSAEYADDEGYLWFAVSDFDANTSYRHTITVAPD